MGRLYKISCKKCGREWEGTVGCGLMHGRLSFAEKAFPEETRRAIHAQIPEQSPGLFDFAYQLTGCRRCGNVVSVPVLKLTEGDKTFIGPCPECGETIGQDGLWTEQLDESPGEQSDGQSDGQGFGAHTCPACREETLSFQMTGLWD